ncbi:MAG: hypothetical protein HZC55_15395 [Verrucomicrobia bacterium]|nr:hypothetical protein [Verrucomicrobiota bacterium]
MALPFGSPPAAIPRIPRAGGRRASPPLPGTDGRGVPVTGPWINRGGWSLLRGLQLLTLALVLCAGAGSLPGQSTRFSEVLTIEWGPVTYTDASQPITRETWFTRTAPSFSGGGTFSEAQQRFLRMSFDACRGTAAGVDVWRLDAEAAESFRQQTVSNPLPGLAVRSVSSPEDGKPDDGKARDWTFSLRVTLEAVQPVRAPDFEIILLVDAVPEGIAWRVPIEDALDSPVVRHYAGLAEKTAAEIRAAGGWARMFLVSAATLEKGPPPATPRVSELASFGVPVAYGVRALAEAITVLGPTRDFGKANHERLVSVLTPGRSTAFAGCDRWFAEVAALTAGLKQFDVESKVGAFDLVQVSYPAPDGPNNWQRVLPDTNAWVVRAGPFLRLPEPVATVGRVRGKTREYTLEELGEVYRSKPDALAQYRRNLAGLERDLTQVLRGAFATAAGREMREARYFWLPAVEKFHAQALHDLGEQRFTTNVSAVLRADRLDYLATFIPATVAGKVGVTYAPEERAGVDAAISGSGLLHPRDAITVGAASAERAITGRLSYKLPLSLSVGGQREHIGEVSGQAGRDEQYRIGRLSSVPFEHRFQNLGVAHVFLYHGTGWSAELRSTLRWDAHQPAASGSVLVGREAGLTLRHEQAWKRTIESAASVRWEVMLEPSLALSPRVGWERAFWQAEMAARTKVWFGGSVGGPSPMYVELRFAAGTGSSALPAVREYRQGDGSRLLGLEPGEFSGHAFTHGQITPGVRASYVWGRLFGTAGRSDGAGGPPFLQGLFLQGLAEVGTVAPARGTLTSYGLGIESGVGQETGAALRFGYAWSRQSNRSRGRLFSTVNWNF